ncbi:hypothetical protein Turpa_0362 [Turneriella parva DSM 21527]|uniref:Uncharacterized protein n=1 Tax=Turneriella parva (strain ATCC BAA-1111 / DSM 21527 / NCTC 11395 / H) TaxID=869212 RepID=I4B161_TURPD|nr:hypothetical protein Turpa_0362 [Turneriella parva DSM 21527]
MPAQAGIHAHDDISLNSRLRGNDLISAIFPPCGSVSSAADITEWSLLCVLVIKALLIS